MDIRKWLEETEQLEAPRETLRRKHAPRRAKTDSSLLEPLAPPAPSPQRETKDKSASELLYPTSSDCSNGSKYARKPRPKTRPDRYQQRSHAHRGRRDNPKKAQRRTKRKKNERSRQVIHNFKAKNVSRDRLTLKPQELGLFNKGRTSTAVRGRGLPDLVFSEMKFLQKHKEPPEPALQPQVHERKRKKDHTHTKEGEISAFFISVRPVPEEESDNSPSEAKRRHRDQVLMSDVVVPTVEPANRESYLASGSRGSRHESTSYISWSESNRAPSTTPARLQVGHGTPHTLPHSKLHGRCNSTTAGGERLHMTDQQHESSGEYTDHEHGLETSSDLGMVLQECKYTLQGQCWAVPSPRRHAERVEPVFLLRPVRRQHRTCSYPATQRTPTVRFVDPPCQNRVRPSFAGPSIYEQQVKRQHLRGESFEEDEFEDDTYAIQQDDVDEDSGLYYGEGGWEEMPEEQIIHDQRDGNHVYKAGNTSAVDYSSEHHRRGNDVVAPGFWRPNKLY